MIAERFYAELAKLDTPRVLEIGTRAWHGPPKHHRADVLKANPAASWLGVDMLPGDGVDRVVDAHELRAHFQTGQFDAFVCVSTLEHFRRPWVVAAQLAQVITPGGLGYVKTHQSFPVHGYPSDYFRFTIEALKELFAADVGWEVLESGYEHPAKVVPLTNAFTHAQDWNFGAEAFLNVAAVVRRV